MEISSAQPQNLSLLFDDGPYDFPEISDRDLAITFLSEIDYEAQLRAIRSILERNKEINLKSSSEIKEIERDAQTLVGVSRERAADEWVDCLYSSVYQDAAHSMAAVGMLAPFIESLFYQGFQGIRQHFIQMKGVPPIDHERWRQATDDAWDCRYVWKKGKGREGITEGIMQLTTAIGLSTFLPDELHRTLQALFEYRNKMFHCGFEWPVMERSKFDRRITDARWPNNWFSKATSNKETWVFYITDTFICHCLDTVDKVIDAFGLFGRNFHQSFPRGHK